MIQLPGIIFEYIPKKPSHSMPASTLHTNFVILADDDQDHGYLFGRILEKVDPSKKLVIAKDGGALLELLTTTVPELLFLDLNMPCKNGFECLREIRHNLKLADLPIIVYSSSSRMTDIQKAYVHQADLYMVKPFNTEHLTNALESVLKMDLKKSAVRKDHYFINNRFVPFTASRQG